MKENGRSPFVWVCLLVVWCAPSTAADQYLPKQHAKHQTIQKVLDDLVRTIGDGRTKPSVRLQAGGDANHLRVAWFESKRHSIIVEERTYDLLVTLDPDSLAALAFLLGHELAHYYKDHGWVGDFRHAFVDVKTAQKLQALAPGQLGTIRSIIDQKAQSDMEMQADYFGGFYGYLAGYNTLEIAPVVLDKIYRAYNVKEDTLGYPSLTQRKAVARQSMDSLHRMVPVFEAGSALLLLKKYREAARCFDYIARFFPSREILNNAGITRGLEALDLMPVSDVRMAYPFELDARSRLRHGRKASEYHDMHDLETVEGEIDRLLQEAREWLEKARQKDPNYATTYVNLACVADLQQAYDEALFFAEQAVKKARRTDSQISLANALIVRGIIHRHTSTDSLDEAAAREDFNAALEGNEVLAKFNLALRDAPVVFNRPSPKKHESAAESIGSLSVLHNDEIIDHADIATALPPTDTFPGAPLHARHVPGGYGLVLETGYSTFTFIWTGREYTGQTKRGIGIGSDMDKVSQAYGDPAYVISGRQGIYHVYRYNQIIFQSDAAKRVKQWMIYGIEE